jgi:hypothetical protein
MSFDKTVSTRIWGVTNQNADLRTTAGDSSAGTFTRIINPLKGSLMWDQAVFVLQGVSVAGGATGGSYTITIQTDAVVGYTALPIARVTGVGPLTKATVVMDNLHKSPASPLPTHIFIDQTATGGGIWFQCHVIAKQYRGSFGTAGVNTAERILQGNLLRGASFPGGNFTDGKGMVADSTFTLGTSGTKLGMDRLRLWDNALYWFVAGNSLSGTHDCNIIGKAGGVSFTIATSGTAGAMTAAGDKVAIASNLYGQSPNPTQIIWDVVSAGGVSDARIVVLAKSGRGGLAKA